MIVCHLGSLNYAPPLRFGAPKLLYTPLSTPSRDLAN